MNKARLNFDLKFPFSRSDGRRGQGMRAALPDPFTSPSQKRNEPIWTARADQISSHSCNAAWPFGDTDVTG